MEYKYIAGGVAVLIVVSLFVYFFFFHNKKKDTGEQTGDTGEQTGDTGDTQRDTKKERNIILKNLFDEFFDRVDEKYTLRTTSPGIQIIEMVVGNVLKVVEELMQLPDLKWATENVIFDDVEIDKINSVISPVFDCVADKIRTVGEDSDLLNQWNDKLDNNDVSLTKGEDGIFIKKIREEGPNYFKNCIDQNITDESRSTIANEYNTLIRNYNNAHNTSHTEIKSEDVDIGILFDEF